MQDFRKLLVWQKSHAMVLAIFETESNRSHQRAVSKACALAKQILAIAAAYNERPESGDLPANIAEGCGRAGRTELKQYLHIALGSASELDYFLVLARDLQLLTPRQYDTLEVKVREIKLMLAGLIKKFAAAPTQSAGAPSEPSISS
jgi:four helix bundle protein